MFFLNEVLLLDYILSLINQFSFNEYIFICSFILVQNSLVDSACISSVALLQKLLHMTWYWKLP